jgi:hypothetical protein
MSDDPREIFESEGVEQMRVRLTQMADRSLKELGMMRRGTPSLL